MMKKPVPLKDLLIRSGDAPRREAGRQSPEQIAATLRRWRVAQAMVEAEAEARRQSRAGRTSRR